MRILSVLLAAVVVGLAGCAESEPAPEPDPDPVQPERVSTVPQTFEAPFAFSAGVDFLVNGVVLGPGTWPFLAMGDDTAVNVTAEWTCASVICPLRMILFEDSGPVAEVQGPSPLTADYGVLPAGSYDLRFFPTDASVVLDVDGTASITMAPQ